VLAGEPLGTLFVAQSGLAGRGAGKRRWIAFATTVEAAIVVNAGARRALVDGKASLLPAGLVEVRGHFARGDVVSILDADGSEFARGLMNYASDEAQAVLGQSSHRLDDLVADRNYDALVTRDNIALLPAAAPAKERA
jgi:glutamate 5-kinase